MTKLSILPISLLSPTFSNFFKNWNGEFSQHFIFGNAKRTKTSNLFLCFQPLKKQNYSFFPHYSFSFLSESNAIKIIKIDSVD